MSAHAFNSRRSTVHSSRGIVSCSQPLAASAGIAVLNAGGNAADAAVAVAAALNVTEPNCTGIGGDAFCLFWDAREKRVRGINGSGRAPEAMTLQRLQQAGLTSGIIPLESVHSVTVPGAPACWDDTVRLFGARAHGDKDGPTLAQVLAPAIRLADNGYPVCAVASGDWVRSEALIKRASPNWAEMMHSSGKAPREGELMRMPNLARTFRELATKGKAGFYEGRVAEEIVKVCGDLGGLMTLADLKHHGDVGSTEITPISYLYKGAAGQKDPSKAVRLHECPPNGQGLVALEALSILDELQASGAVPDLLTLEHNSPEYLHALIVALRLGFADAGKYVADPDFEGAKHVEAILSPEYAKERAKLFDAKAFKPVEHGNPRNSSDTVYFSVVDQEGNACSFINSNYAGFGSAIIPAGCGFTLQNRGSGFVLEEGHANCVAPRKRPYHTIIPAMATREVNGEAECWLSYGVMGGYMQPQGHVQVLLNMLRGMSPQQAIDSPRLMIGAGTPDQGDVLSTVFLEDGIDESAVEVLRGMGHDVQYVKGWEKRGQFGKGQCIARIDYGAGRSAWAAGSDPRGDGCAVPQV